MSRASSWALRAAAGVVTLEVARRPWKGRKGLEVKGFIMATENQSVEEGKSLSKSPSRSVAEWSGHRHTGVPAKSLHCSWGGPAPPLNLPALQGAAPLLRWHRGPLSYLWAVLEQIQQGLQCWGREEGDHVGTCFFLPVAASPSQPWG